MDAIDAVSSRVRAVFQMGHPCAAAHDVSSGEFMNALGVPDINGELLRNNLLARFETFKAQTKTLVYAFLNKS